MKAFNLYSCLLIGSVLLLVTISGCVACCTGELEQTGGFPAAV